jgi:hypothetical protein
MSSNDNFKSLNFESIDFQKSLNRDSESVSTYFDLKRQLTLPPTYTKLLGSNVSSLYI